MAAIGLAFWTAAGWFFLLTLTTPLNAAVIMAAMWTGAGLIGFAITSALSDRQHRPAAPPPQTAPTIESVTAAFVSGMTAGFKTRF